MADRSVRQGDSGGDGRTVRLDSLASRMASMGASLGAFRLESSGRVRRAKTLDELDLDAGTGLESIGYHVDDDEVLAMGGLQQW